ncbi:LysR family transcriptional regulator [Spongiactinospora rosea]|uniref:LysR family transcriptional regulator n=1 Tax=Spongiactinospora rosea TaxID=2248750 RepID=A0A366LYN8_9ACTN|nr:LysR family transcriptional regulator [Spongiactinospora rosea]RBQ18887.1 LysR family transcriptional regulator [Spongiactinospora rosea]
MDLEVRHLRAICAIADCGSISKAAVHLRTSQPALAAQLRRIERMFGGPLFERGREGARPTPLGAWVLLRSRSILPAFDELQRDGRRYTGQTLIRVGCAPTRLAIHVSECLHRLAGGTRVAMRTEEAVDVLPELLESERLELAVLPDYPGHELAPRPGVAYSVIAVEPMFVGLTASHPLAAREEVELADLADEEWTLPAVVENGHREHFLAACAVKGFSPVVSYSLHTSVALGMIGAGRCVGMFQATSRESPGIVIRPVAGTPLRHRHVLGWTEHGPMAGFAADLVRSVTQAYWADALNAPIYASWLKRHGPLPQPAHNAALSVP